MSSSENSHSHGLQTSNCAASPRPVNLPVGASSDVSSQMTLLNERPSSRGSVAGMCEHGNVFIICLMLSFTGDSCLSSPSKATPLHILHSAHVSRHPSDTTNCTYVLYRGSLKGVVRGGVAPSGTLRGVAL